MYPKPEKMTKPARILVTELMMDIVRVSLCGGEDVVKWLSKKVFLLPRHHYWHCRGREKLSGFLLENVVVEGVVA